MFDDKGIARIERTGQAWRRPRRRCRSGWRYAARTVRRGLSRKGAICQASWDTEVILHLVARSQREKFIDRFIDALFQIEGAYAFVGLTNKKLIGARDPLGIRPLVLGELDGHYIL